ncbi:hypothetical protein ACJ73_01440 [Blastomyces percursus]|uniref:Complex 1 LYR protein domain-containing protein n=1 Tax=Blastomyces percursus TaxID=1658174 RepID=A0A1J9QF85_9EURO|nr:hypothetical protein ACJ73_01440 [Blastomyces percursus]
MSVVTQANSAYQARSLFRSLLRQSRQFAAYNFREYARRRTIDAFREHQHVTEERKIQELMQKGLQDLRMMKRQTIISQFYQLDKLVVEGEPTGKEIGNAGGIVRQKDTGGVELTLCIYRELFFFKLFSSFSWFLLMGDFDLLAAIPALIFVIPTVLFSRLISTEQNYIFRSSRRSQALTENGPNRTRTGQADHDVFEGFPVRRWVRQPVVVYQNPKVEQPDTRIGGSQALPELPMPRDSHLLTPMSRALLRAARAGCKYIRPAPTEVEDDDKEIKDSDEPVSAPPFERTFTAGKWTLVPRYIEPPEAEFLAKRRAGLSSLYGSTAINGTAEVQPEPKVPMRKTKFKKVDPTTGNVSIYEAWVPEGHKVEGEITENTEAVPENSDATIVGASPAPGTIVEGVGMVDTQGVGFAETHSTMVAPMKEHPPLKRKAKGIGKGSRKKVMFAPGEGEMAATTPGGTETSGDMTMSGTAQDGSSTATPGLQDEDEDEDEENEGEESDEGEGSAAESKSPGTLIKSDQEDAGNAQTVAEKEESNLDIHEQSSLAKQEQHKDAAILPRDKSNSPGLPPTTSTTTIRPTELPDEEIPPPPQSQPQAAMPPVPIDMPSSFPVQPVADVSEPTKDISFSNTQPQHSESANNEVKAPVDNQNDNSTLQEKSNSPIDGVNPDTASQPFHPQEYPSTTSTPPEPHSATVRFENGEVDLLGSLEASLDNPSKTATARNHNRFSPTIEASGKSAVDVSEQDASVRENDERGGSSDEKKDVEMTG